MYYVLVKTLPEKLSTFIPHIIEHCVLWNKDIALEEFFFRTFGFTWITCTSFEVQDKISKEDCLQRLFLKIDPKIYEYENGVIKKELGIYDTDDEWFTVLSQIYWHYDTELYKDTEYADIARYHEKYYILDNIVFFDEDWKVIDLHHNLTVASPSKLDMTTLRHNFQFATNKKRVFTLSSHTWENVVFMYFVCNLFNYYHVKKKRYELWEYDFTKYSWGMSMLDIYFRGPALDEHIVPKDFFEAFKAAFIEKMRDWYHNKPLSYWILYNKMIVSDEDVKSFINWLDYGDIVKVITKPIQAYTGSLEERYERANAFQERIGQPPMVFSDFSVMYEKYLKDIDALKK